MASETRVFVVGLCRCSVRVRGSKLDAKEVDLWSRDGSLRRYGHWLLRDEHGRPQSAARVYKLLHNYAALLSLETAGLLPIAAGVAWQ